MSYPQPSRRESQVAICILFGRTSREIAAELRITRKCVHFYTGQLFRKFGAHNRHHLVATMMRQPRCGAA